MIGQHSSNLCAEPRPSITPTGFASTIGKSIGMPRPIVSIPPWLGLAVARVVGRVLGDVLVTRDEIAGLMADLLYVPGAPSKGTTRFTEWARENARTLGRVYLSELAR